MLSVFASCLICHRTMIDIARSLSVADSTTPLSPLLGSPRPVVVELAFGERWYEIQFVLGDWRE